MQTSPVVSKIIRVFCYFSNYNLVLESISGTNNVLFNVFCKNEMLEVGFKLMY